MKIHIAVLSSLIVMMLAGCQQAVPGQPSTPAVEPVATVEQPSTPVEPAEAQQTAELKLQTENKIESGYSLDDPREIIFVSAGGETKTMADSAKKQLSDNDEKITSFDIPVDPDDSNIVFISTSTSWSGKDPYTNRIYKYDLDSGELKELVAKDFSMVTLGVLWRTIGREGSKVIVMNDGIDNSPGPCFSIWAGWDSFSYLDIRNVSEGLKPYTVPQYKIDEDMQDQQKCSAEIAG